MNRLGNPIPPRPRYSRPIALLWLAFVLFTAPFTANTAAAANRAGEPYVILAFGDSLTAGYGLAPGEAYPVRLEAALSAGGRAVEVRNAGVSGDTTSGGRRRLAWTLKAAPDLVILELGANDALRGIDPALTRANLDAMLSTLGQRGIPVLLAGMLAPPNYGDRYAAAFNAIFPELAAKHGVALYPFFLDGVAADPALNQADTLHPNAEGIKVIVDKLLPHVRALIDDAP